MYLGSIYKRKIQYNFPLYLEGSYVDNTGGIGWCGRITPGWDTKQIGTYLSRNIQIAYCNFMLLKSLYVESGHFSTRPST